MLPKGCNRWFVTSSLGSDARYYPRMHVVPDGRVFMSGPLNLTQFLDTSSKQWTPVGNRTPNPNANALMEYAPSVLYDEGGS